MPFPCIVISNETTQIRNVPGIATVEYYLADEQQQEFALMYKGGAHTLVAATGFG
jgi:hypothetical protein